MTKAEFIENGVIIYQTYDELYQEAENTTNIYSYQGTEDEIDEQQDEDILDYLHDCYYATINTPMNELNDPINFHQWLDWLELGCYM